MWILIDSDLTKSSTLLIVFRSSNSIYSTHSARCRIAHTWTLEENGTETCIYEVVECIFLLFTKHNMRSSFTEISQFAAKEFTEIGKNRMEDGESILFSEICVISFYRYCSRCARLLNWSEPNQSERWAIVCDVCGESRAIDAINKVLNTERFGCEINNWLIYTCLWPLASG